MKLEVQKLCFRYVRDRDVFRDLDFTLEDGELLSILGANGAGKSTLLNCVSGLYRPQAGEILLDGKSLSSMSRVEIARLIGYVPQLHDSSFAYSLLEYAVMGRTPYIRAYSTPSREDYAIAHRNLCRVGLGDMENRVLPELSGGEQQLGMIARVLTQESRLILLDEPANHLDFGNQYRVLETLQQLSTEGYLIIITTHNPDHALKLGGKAGILRSGGGLTIGATDEILTGETLSELYRLPVGVEYSETAGRRICFVRERQTVQER